MDTLKKGKCINFSNCAKADKHEIIETSLTEDFECPECNSELQEVKTKNSNGSSLSKKIIIAAAVLAVGAVGVYLLFSGDGAKTVVSIAPESATVKIDETVRLTVKTDPEDAAKKMKWSWASSDENIVTVSKNGVVAGVAAGNVTITVRDEKNGVSATASIAVESKPAPEPEQTTTKPEQTTKPVNRPTNSTYSFGKYEGNLVNGIPEGQGTMYYTCRVQIAKHGRNTYYAEKGDTFVGTWANGDIVNGKLYDGNNNQKAAILAGKRPNPYDLKNDKCE